MRPAMVFLGDNYYSGLGVDQNYETALEWYHKAADEGNALAMLVDRHHALLRRRRAGR